MAKITGVYSITTTTYAKSVARVGVFVNRVAGGGEVNLCEAHAPEGRFCILMQPKLSNP